MRDKIELEEDEQGSSMRNMHTRRSKELFSSHFSSKATPKAVMGENMHNEVVFKSR